jgi:hypothetical protein
VEFDYVVQRQRQTGNPYLKAKYSHLLWLSPQKHFRFASDALKAYVQIITNLNKTAWDKEAKRDVHDLKTNISNALYLASSTGNVKEIAKVKSLTIRIARKFRFDNDKTFTNVLLMDES